MKSKITWYFLGYIIYCPIFNDSCWYGMRVLAMVLSRQRYLF